MIKNYLKVAWRNLIKNKTHTFINVSGLSVGMAVAMLIGLWIWDELSYDKYHENYNRVVKVMQHQAINGTTFSQVAIPIPLGTMLRNDYTGPNRDFKYMVLSSWNFEHILTVGDKKLSMTGSYMQPEAPDMLTLKMLKGTRKGLQDPLSIVISQKVATAMFGGDDPLGKTIRIDNKKDVTVTGVYEDLPRNTEFNELTYILPWELYLQTEEWLKRASTQWGNNSFQLFAQLNDGADITKVDARIKDLKKKNIAAQGDKVGASFNPQVFLHPMEKWHLYSEFKDGKNTGGAIQFVWLFGIIGVFVLLLACINFMNLSTAPLRKTR
jgi:putative ABC transport system permease protein